MNNEEIKKKIMDSIDAKVRNEYLGRGYSNEEINKIVQEKTTVKERNFRELKESIGELVTDEEKLEIVLQYDFKDGETPKVNITQDPDVFASSVATSIVGSEEKRIETEVLSGDLVPSVDEIRDDEVKSLQMADFSMKKIQIALVRKIEGFYGEKISEYIQVYIPEQKEYPQGDSYFQMTAEKKYNQFFMMIKDQVGDKLTDEQISNILEDVYLGDEKPPVIVTSDPRKFGAQAAVEENIDDDYYGEHAQKNLELIQGDCEFGYFDFYTRRNTDGRLTYSSEEHVMPDFSVDKLQIVRMYEPDESYGDKMEIHIYIPEEKEYPEDVSYKTMIINDRAKKLHDDIKKKTEGKLTEEQINAIVQQQDLESWQDTMLIPEIIVTGDPFRFEANSRRSEYRCTIGSAHTNERREEHQYSNAIIGDYRIGSENIIRHVDEEDEQDIEEEPANFGLGTIQAACVTRTSYSNFEDSDYENEEHNVIAIYIPDKNKNLEGKTFEQLVASKKLEELKKQMDELKEEGQKIDLLQKQIRELKEGQPSIGE